MCEYNSSGTLPRWHMREHKAAACSDARLAGQGHQAANQRDKGAPPLKQVQEACAPRLQSFDGASEYVRTDLPAYDATELVEGELVRTKLR